MRVCVVTTSYPLAPGQAAGHFVAAEVRQLCAQGHQVDVIAPGPVHATSGDNPRVFRVAAGKLFGPPGALPRLRNRPFRAVQGVAFIWRARRLLAELGPFERVVAHWLVPCAWPIATRRAPALEAVAHGSDVRLLCKLPRWLLRSLLKELTRTGTELRFVSHEQRALLERAADMSLGASRVAPAALDLAASPSRGVARRALQLADDVRLLLVVARLVPGKRVSTALAAVSFLPDATVVVVGGGPLLPELARRFPSVRFTGQLSHPETLSWIAAADVLLSASKAEGAPTAVREARALGVPVVALESGDLCTWAVDDPGLWVAKSASCEPSAQSSAQTSVEGPTGVLAP
jgi:teichuronic acid biosynthesis glycosyltransferase TuaC